MTPPPFTLLRCRARRLVFVPGDGRTWRPLELAELLPLEQLEQLPRKRPRPRIPPPGQSRPPAGDAQTAPRAHSSHQDGRAGVDGRNVDRAHQDAPAATCAALWRKLAPLARATADRRRPGAAVLRWRLCAAAASVGILEQLPPLVVAHG